MNVAVLGPQAVHTEAGTVTIGAAKERGLLSMLALHAGKAVAIYELEAALWGENSPPSARKAIQGYISHLRRLLPDGVLSTSPSGYRLDIPADSVDALCFERLVAQGRRRLAEGHGEVAIPMLRDALALWRGPALTELADHDAGRAEAVRLEELRRSAEEDLADARLARGLHHELIADLQLAVAAEPLRERRWEQLMLALYRCGRQAEALRTYRRLYEYLGEELGVEPSPRLKELEQAVLLQRAELAFVATGGDAGPTSPGGPGAGEVTGPGLAPGPPLRRRIPEPPTSFIGRETELSSLRRLVEQRRLVTITGPGGSGKTRLAVHFANLASDGFPDGLLFVELGAVDSDGVLPRLASVLGVQPEAGQTLGEVVLARLQGRAPLMVLDNCEHVVTASAELAEMLTSTCPDLRIVATSREPLRCQGEARLLLTSLPVPDTEREGIERTTRCPSVRLLIERSASFSPVLDLDRETVEALAEICRRVDGLPLALELAAARLALFRPAELVSRLADPLNVLTVGARTAADRHRTLRKTIDWSFGLLPADEQLVFRRLSVFVGGAGLRELGAVCRPLSDDQTTDAVGMLLDKSLVVHLGDPLPVRVRMHQTVRRYAREKLKASEEEAEVRGRHARAFADAADVWTDQLHGPRQHLALRQLSTEFENIRAAFDWMVSEGPAHEALRLSTKLWWFWLRTNRVDEGRRWLDQALERCVAADDDLRSRAWGVAGYLAWSADDFDVARDLAGRALSGGHGISLPSRALAYAVLARVESDLGAFAEATAAARESQRLYTRLGDKWKIAWARRCHASALCNQRELRRATILAERSLHEFQELDDAWGIAGTLDNLARTALAAGETEKAVTLAWEAVVRHRQVQSASGLRQALVHLAAAAREAGRHEVAEAAASESLALARSYGYRVGACHALLELAQLALDRHDEPEAARLGREAADLARAVADTNAEETARAVVRKAGGCSPATARSN